MKRILNDLSALNGRLKQIARDPVRIEDAGEVLACGQIWSATRNGGDIPTWCLLLTESLLDGLFNALPVFRWGEKAGPHDVYVPKSIIGATLIASLDLETTVDRTMLDKCHGRVPQRAVDFLLRAKEVQDDPVQRNAYSWGTSYLSGADHRLVYHASINSCLEASQSNVRALVLRAERAQIMSPVRNVLLNSSLARVLAVDFSGFFKRQEFAMAASGRDPERRLTSSSFRCIAPAVRITISECVAPTDIAVEVVEDLEGVTRGATVIDSSGNPLGTLAANGVVHIRRPDPFRMGVRLSDGRCLDLHIEEG